MKALCGVIAVALVAGCATESSVVLPEALRASMRDSPTAVLFTDDVGVIRFRVGSVNMPGLVGPYDTIQYGDAWDAGPSVTAVHAHELAKLGFTVASAYSLVGEQALPPLTAVGRENRAKNYEIIPVVTPDLASALQARGQRLLFWVTWSGLQVFHTPLGRPVEQTSSSYWLFDVVTRRLMWSGGLADIRDSDLKSSDDAKQLQADNFKAFKRLVVERYQLAYRHEEDTVPWLLGILGTK